MTDRNNATGFLSTYALGMVLLASLATILLLLAPRYTSVNRAKAPRMGIEPRDWIALSKARADFMKNGRQLVEEGYKKHKSSMFIVQTADMERVVLSNKYAEELRSYPTSHLSSKEAQCDRHLARWNTLDVVKKSDLHTKITRTKLNHHLHELVPVLAEEARLAWLEKLNLDDEPGGYRYAHASQLTFDIIARIVNRAIVGLPVCRNSEWTEAAAGWASEAFAISSSLRSFSPLLRPFVYLGLPSRRRLREHMETANRILISEILLRKQEDSKHLDMLQWMIQDAQGTDANPKELTHKTLFLCLASVVSSSMGVCHAIYDLCAHPEYVEPLRSEIDNMWRENGEWTLPGLLKLKRLDSFLRESQRINHPGLFSFNRKVMKNITLSDGHFLPAGTFLSMPTYCFARDPDYYEHPEELRPFRFLDLSDANPEAAHRQQFTATSITNMPWGYGNSACPGRFFAACEIKLALATLLYSYDFQFSPGQTTRPENTYVDERIWPSKTQQVGFRRRELQ